MSNDSDSLYDDIEAARLNEKLISEEETAQQAAGAAQLKNISLTETDVHLVGDRTVIAQVVQLLSYLRHAVRNNMKCCIRVSVGNEQANAELNFDVNGCQVPDLVTPPEFEIN